LVAVPTSVAGVSLTGLAQPPLTADTLSRSRGALLRYRTMAFVTGVVLLAGCVALIFKYGTSLHVHTWTTILWIAHGYLYIVYVVVTAILGVRLRWPIGRFALVMLAGTIPTMSFVAEHFVTRSIRAAVIDAPAEDSAGQATDPATDQASA
jgi:integral membrane protein